jgi:zinc D-Ala-D-Ala carboxypeptidase
MLIIMKRSLIMAYALLALGSAWGTDLSLAIGALKASAIPKAPMAAIEARIEADPKTFLSLLEKAQNDRKADPMLLYKVDKGKSLPKGYVPDDLVSLDGRGLSLGKSALRLRKAALQSLMAMDKAARAEGITLVVSSTYRSVDYQQQLWDRSVAKEGMAETEASLAQPGHSQHHLGTAIDFGSITDAFADTKASRWLAAKARGYGFTLSFPKGMSEVTGYKWESWHYRYIGAAAAAIEGRYFDGVQQYLMLFLDALS